MQGKTKLMRTMGTIFFSIGILAGMVMFILMNWAYFEAYFYFGYIPPADESITTLRCPLLMTTADSGVVTIRLANNSDRDISPAIRTEISYYGAARSEKTNYPVAAGETRTLSWAVTSDDMVFGHLIMARITIPRTYTLPSRQNTCGTIVVSLPWLTGIELFAFWLALILVCLAVGWGLWLAGNRPLQADGMITLLAMAIFTVLVLLGIAAGCIGWWGVGLVCTAVSVLLLFAVVGNFIQRA
jgi:hypothetical protein